MKTTLTLNSITFAEGLEPRGKKPYVLALVVSGRGLPEGENLEFGLTSVPGIHVERAELLSVEDPGGWIIGEALVLDSEAGREAASRVIDRIRPGLDAGPFVARLRSLAPETPLRIVEHGIGQVLSEIVAALTRSGDRLLGRAPVKAAVPAKSIGFEVTDKASGARFRFGLSVESEAVLVPGAMAGPVAEPVIQAEPVPATKPARKPRRGRKAPRGRKS